jgi:carbon monoxide dehydrogenase subunit G
MRIEQSFTVRRPPAEVFAYMTDPANLAAWQPSKVAVEPLTPGPPRQGYRLRERTRIGRREWDQVVEFTEFEPGRALATHIVDGAVPVDGRWALSPEGAQGTQVRFVAEGELHGAMRLAAPLLRLGIARSFRQYHALLAEQVEAQPSSASQSPEHSR